MEGGYVEGVAMATKTARSQEKKKTTFLPISAPVQGLMEVDWWSAFEEARIKLGLKKDSRKGKEKGNEGARSPPDKRDLERTGVG